MDSPLVSKSPTPAYSSTNFIIRLDPPTTRAESAHACDGLDPHGPGRACVGAGEVSRTRRVYGRPGGAGCQALREHVHGVPSRTRWDGARPRRGAVHEDLFGRDAAGGLHHDQDHDAAKRTGVAV